MGSMFASSMFVLCFMQSLIAPQVAAAEDKIKMQDLRNITFRNGKYTSGTRGRPVPQMACGCRFQVDCNCGSIEGDITCHNHGIREENSLSYPPLYWECENEDLSSLKHLHHIEVSCDCATDCRDDYISISSCYLRYAASWKSYGEYLAVLRRVLYGLVLLVIVLSIMLLIAVIIRIRKCMRKTETSSET